jgi:hypothetical protein
MKNRNKKFFAGISIFIALVICLFQQINLASADAGITLTVKNPDPYTGNQSWFVYTKNPGDVINDIASIKNYGDEKASVKIYPVDGETTSGGSFILKFNQENQIGIGNWTKMQTKELEVMPGERVDVPFQIDVPKEISPGQYIGGIVIEYGTAASDKTSGNCDRTQKDNGCDNSVVNVKTRIGSRIYVNISGEAEENVALTDFSYYTTISGQPRFKFKIENKGNVSYQPVAQIEVRDGMGNLYDSFSKSIGVVMPGSTTEPTISWDKETPFIGKFTATASVSFQKRFQGELTALHAAASSKTVVFWIAPWIYLIFAFLIILAGSALCTFCKLRFKKLVSTSEKYQVGENDDLLAIAAKQNISWKKLAKINKLKPPFIIKKGQVINLPKQKKQ